MRFSAAAEPAPGGRAARRTVRSTAAPPVASPSPSSGRRVWSGPDDRRTCWSGSRERLRGSHHHRSVRRWYVRRRDGRPSLGCGDQLYEAVFGTDSEGAVDVFEGEVRDSSRRVARVEPTLADRGGLGEADPPDFGARERGPRNSDHRRRETVRRRGSRSSTATTPRRPGIGGKDGRAPVATTNRRDWIVRPSTSRVHGADDIEMLGSFDVVLDGVIGYSLTGCTARSGRHIDH